MTLLSTETTAEIRTAITAVRRAGDTVCIDITDRIELVCKLPTRATHIEVLLYVESPALPPDSDVRTDAEAMAVGGRATRLHTLTTEFAAFETTLQTLVQTVCGNTAVLELKAIDYTEPTDGAMPAFYTFHGQMALRATSSG